MQRSLVIEAPEGIAPDEDVLLIGADIREYVRNRIVRYPVRDRIDRLVNLFDDGGPLAMKYDNGSTRNAQETFDQRSGNCLAFTQLFVAMAREAGLHARFREERLMPTWTKLGDVFALNRHMTVWGSANGDTYEVDFGRFGIGSRSNRIISDERARALYFNNRGAEEFAAGNVSGAFPFVHRALTIEPALADGWSNLGALLAREKRFVDAERAYRYALDLDPNIEVALLGLERLYRNNEKPDLAREYHEYAQSARERNPYFQYNLATDALARARPDEAVGYLDEAIRLKDDEPDFHFLLGRAYLDLGERRRALQAFKRVETLTTDTDQERIYSQRLIQVIDQIKAQQASSAGHG